MDNLEGLKINEHYASITADGHNFGFVGAVVKTYKNVRSGRVVSLLVGDALTLDGKLRVTNVYVVKLDGVTVWSGSPNFESFKLVRGFYDALRFACRRLAGQSYSGELAWSTIFSCVTCKNSIGTITGITPAERKTALYKWSFHPELLEEVEAYSRNG